MTDDYIRRIEAALAEGTFDFGQLCCEKGESSGSPDEPPVCCGQPLSCADDIRALLDRLRAAEVENERMREALERLARLENGDQVYECSPRSTKNEAQFYSRP